MTTTGKSSRDTQRGRVYAWERQTFGHRIWTAELALAELEALVNRIWRSERGRVGQAKRPAPIVVARRGSSAEAFSNAHGRAQIFFGAHCHNRIVVLHELAHCLTPSDQSHGPRFVGVLIGLYCRHLDCDAKELMASADEMGVKYHVRSIGCVPVHGPAWHVARALREEGPMSAMDMASWLSLACGVDITPKRVRGAALSLIRAKQARWLRNKLTPLPARDERC